LQALRATGRSRWRHPGPARPLLAVEGAAYVLEELLPGALRVSRLDLATGRDAVGWPLPRGAVPPWASLAEGSSGRTQTTVAVQARLRGALLEVGLHARHVTIGGMGILPGPEVWTVASVDVRSGDVRVTPGARLEPDPISAPAPAGAGPLARFHARALDEQIVRGGPPPDVAGVLVADGALVGFERAPGKVVVHRWSAPAGKRAAPVVLAAADADAIWPTLDRRHVALRRARDQRRVDLYALGGGTPPYWPEGMMLSAVPA